MDTKIEKLRQLLATYKSSGILSGNELLLPPQIALRLLDDLVNIDVAVMGTDVWHYVDRKKGWIVQDLAVDFSVDERLLDQVDAAEKTIAAVQHFLNTQLPDRTELVSFTFYVPPELKLF